MVRFGMNVRWLMREYEDGQDDRRGFRFPVGIEGALYLGKSGFVGKISEGRIA